MNVNWHRFKLGEICSFKYGEMPKKSELVAQGYPIFSGYRLVGHSCRYHYNDPEIIVVARGVGGTGDIKMSPPFCFLTNLSIAVLIKAAELNKTFLFYRLASTKLWELRTGSAQAQITIERLTNYEVEVPPLGLQKKIAAILSAYDDLIEKNTRRIKILEKMAQALYREWFVHFRFPGHEKVKMVPSPLGPIPQGWEVCKLKDHVELAYGRALKAEDRAVGPFPVYGSSGVVGYHSCKLVEGPGIIVGRKGNVGSVYWSDESFYPIDTVYFVQTKLPLFYVFYNLQEQNFINNDAAVPGLNRNQAYSLAFLLPRPGLLNAFGDFCKPAFEQLRNVRSRNLNLHRTRDLLLPKLVSGEIDVSNLDIR